MLSVLQNHRAELFPLTRGSVVHIGTKRKRPTNSLNLKEKTRILYRGEGKRKIAQIKTCKNLSMRWR